MVGGHSCVPLSKNLGRELALQSVDAIWAGPLEIPFSVLDKPTVEMVSPKETQVDLEIPEHVR